MRKFPVLPPVFGFDPPLSILDTLGAVDSGTVPADGRTFAELVVSAATDQAGLQTLSDAEGASLAIQSAVGLLSLPIQATSDFGNAALGGGPSDAGEVTQLEMMSSAKGGQPGGGGGGGGGGVLTEYLSGSANGEAGYDIWIQFKGSGWTADLQQAFTHAADYFTTVITDDIGGGGRIRKMTVDDLYVTAEVKAIDGGGGILGQAGPTSVWTASELTAAGQMQFDIADALTYLGKGLWDDIVTHELMHVLGFGSLWNYGTNPLVSGNQYLGQNALAAYQETHPGALFIPVEDGGGSGTAGSHWDEEALANELMTGYIDDDQDSATINDNQLSEFSVMSLADLGYDVTYGDYPWDGLTA
jgi:hypothetical protein